MDSLSLLNVLAALESAKALSLRTLGPGADPVSSQVLKFSLFFGRRNELDDLLRLERSELIKQVDKDPSKVLWWRDCMEEESATLRCGKCGKRWRVLADEENCQNVCPKCGDTPHATEEELPEGSEYDDRDQS